MRYNVYIIRNDGDGSEELVASNKSGVESYLLVSWYIGCGIGAWRLPAKED